MDTKDLILFLRKQFRILEPTDMNEDDLLVMTDAELAQVIDLAMTKDFADYQVLEDLPKENIYPLKLLVQKELCLTLALLRAESIDLVADNNNQLHEDQLFKHYMSLADKFDTLYKDYLDDGGVNGKIINTYDILLNRRYFTQRYYEKTIAPKIRLSIDNVTATEINLSWVCSVNRLLNYAVYVGTKPFYDNYSVLKIHENAKLIKKTSDIRDRTARIDGLYPDTEYYILVMITELNGISSVDMANVITSDELIFSGF